MIAAFEAAHRKQFGFVFEGKTIVVESLEVEAVGGGADIDEPEAAAGRGDARTPDETHALLFRAAAWHEAAVYLRDHLRPGATVAGAALIIEPHQTIVVEPRLAGRSDGAEPHRAPPRRARCRSGRRSAPTSIR